MLDVLKIKCEKDSENKRFLIAMTIFGGVAEGSIITGLLSALGGFAPEISADKEEKRGNPDGFQVSLTQNSGNLWCEAVCGDLFSGSLKVPYHPGPCWAD